MKKLLLLVALFVTGFAGKAQTITPAAGGIVYVKKGSTGNGSSWSNAAGELADALKFAHSNTVSQIWVAGGTYTSLYSPAYDNFGNGDGYNNAFLLVKDVKVYGGFAGTETSLAQRNLTLTANASILDGQSLRFHILISAGDAGSAELNGFTITHSNSGGANKDYISVNTEAVSNSVGGGMYISNSSPVLSNLIVKDNIAYSYGGGILCTNNAYPVLTGIVVSGNESFLGAGMYNQVSNPILTNVTLISNYCFFSSGVKGGGMYNNSSSPILTNVAILDNVCPSNANDGTALGGGMYNKGSSPVLSNVTIAGNRTSDGGGAIYNESSSPKLYNCIIYNNNLGGVANDAPSLPVYTNCLVQDNPAGTNMVNYTGAATSVFVNPDVSVNDYSLRFGSPAINLGSNAFITQYIDLAGNPRIRNNTVDIGAYEFQSGNTILITASDANGILYVKKNGAGNFTGNSWANALPELADALKFAKIRNATGLNTQVAQIWVAGGVYKPLYSPADNNFGNADGRNNAFLLVNNVKMYGGFAGTEITLAQRNLTLTANKSTLSADFNGDDATSGSGAALNITGNTENAYHVIVCSGDAGQAVIDGFSLTGGNANANGAIGVNAQAISQGDGGGIITSSASDTVTNLTLTHNYANFGGGISNLSSSPVLINVVITGNVARTFGGGVRNITSSPQLTNVAISGNNASIGGGICNNASSPILINSALSGNNATISGGGMFASSSSSPLLTSTTVSGNTAPQPGSDLYISGGTTTITNSIVFSSGPVPVFNDANGGSFVATYSLVYGINAGIGNIDPTGYTATEVFTNPANNDFTLKSGSPASNAGSNALYTGNINTDKDLAGNVRLQNGTIDLGAYESPYFGASPDVNGIVYVKKGSTGQGSSWASAAGEVADALAAAKTNTAITQIWVAAGLYKPLYRADNFAGPDTTDRDNAFLLSTTSSLKLFGGFAGNETTLAQRDLTITANKTTLSGDFNGNDAVTGSGAGLTFTGNAENAYHVIVSVGPAGKSIPDQLDGFTIIGGNANASSAITVAGQTISQGAGGGISNTSASPLLTNVTLTGNKASNFGGGIYNSSSSPILTNAVLVGNNAVNGGGMYNISSSPILNYVVIKGNNTSSGGGISNSSSFPALNNVIISGNNSSNNGGGINNTSSSPSLTNVTVSGNTAANGSQLYIFGGTTTVVNSIVFGSGALPILINNAVFSGSVNATYSLVSGISTGTGNLNASGYTAAQIFANASTGDYTLNTGSPAIDAGSNTLYNGNINTDKDLAGNMRLFGAIIDLGPYEKQQVINPVADIFKTYGDADFSPATATSGLAITYTSSDTTVVNVSGTGQLHIKSAGISTITASQPGNATVMAATPVNFNVTVAKKVLDITATGINKLYDGNTLASVTLSDNRVSGDTVTAAYAAAAFTDQNAGTAKFVSVSGITISGAAAANYLQGNTTAATTADITADTLTYIATPVTRLFGTANPAITGIIAGFVNGETQASATTGTLTFTTTATIASPGGSYPITGSGLTTTTNNYVLVQAPGNSTAFYIPTAITATTGPGIIYVKKGITTGNFSGSSWANAAPELAEALKFTQTNNAVHTNPQVTQIWVAGGVYLPYYRADSLTSLSTTDRNNAFVLVNNVKLYGGFAGTESTLAQRNLSLIANKSTLSGDFNGDDVITGTGSTLAFTQNLENTYHVVISAGTIGTAELNGFTISGGNNSDQDVNNRYNYFIQVNRQSIYRVNGGGMVNLYSSPLLNNVTISGNDAAFAGGGIYDYQCSPLLANSTISSNNVKDLGYGGGMYNILSSPVLTNVTISGNSSAYRGSGGGLYNESLSSPVLNNVVITGNYAAVGGGIKNYRNASLVLNNVLITGNNSFIGGGINNQTASATLTNVTISGNTAQNNASELSQTGGGTITISNSIIFNSGVSPIENDNTSVVNATYSLISGNTTGTGNLNASTYTEPQIFTNTATGNYTLNTAGTPSPAINAGSNTLVIQATDLAGGARIRDNIVDMGAYEVQNGNTITVTMPPPVTYDTLYVKKGATGNGSSWANAMGELADALKFAKTNNVANTSFWVSQVWVAGGVYQPLYRLDDLTGPNTTDRNNAFLLVSNVKVYGGFAGNEITLAQRNLTLTINKSVLSGDFNGDDVIAGAGAALNITANGENAYHVVVSIDAGDIVELNGFTISGGNANSNASLTVNGSGINQNSGGGMLHYRSSPILSNLILSGSNASTSGGGMFNWGGSPIIDKISVSGNTASNGGAGMYNLYSSPLISNAAINNNNTAGVGGGMYNYIAAFPALNTVTIVGNTANAGAQIYQSAGTATIGNSIIYGPAATALSGNITATYSLLPGVAGTGNIEVSNYTASQIFTDSANGDYTLKAGSPAIDAGSNALYTGNILTDKDLAGNLRLYGSIIDMGAYEAQPQVVLPVTLVSFTSVLQGKNNALLQWKTSSEINNKGYGIEMSATGNAYKSMGFVEGHGTTGLSNNYGDIIPGLMPGTYYFRLKIVDMDGRFVYSPVRMIKVTNALEVTINVYPNPVIDGYVYINILNAANKKVKVSITNALGQVIQQADYINIAGPKKIKLPFSKGTFYIHVTTSDGSYVVKKIIRL